MTISELYRKHAAGEVSKEKFLYEARRDSKLPWILNTTSYDDAVKILKNKAIISEEAIPGGVGANLSPMDVDPSELEMGIEIEMEHTNDPEVAREIALDHLAEDPMYYSKFKASGIEDKSNIDLSDPSQFSQYMGNLGSPDRMFWETDDLTEDHDPKLFSIILKYVSDPDEAEQYEDSDPESWPDWLVSNLEQDPEYQELMSSRGGDDFSFVDKDDIDDTMSGLDDYISKININEEISGTMAQLLLYYGIAAFGLGYALRDPEIGDAIDAIMVNPITAIKNWIKRNKDDKATKKIVNRLASDPEVVAAAKSNKRGIRKVVDSKLQPEEKKYLRKITRNQILSPKIKEGDFAMSGRLKHGEEQKIKSQIPDAEVEQGQDDDRYYTSVSSKSKSNEEIRSIIDKIMKGDKALSEAKKKKLNEAKENSGFTYIQEPLLRNAIDYVDPYQMARAVQFELQKAGDYSSESLNKCIAKVVKNLSKDPVFYKDLQIANYKEVKAKDKELEMKPVKKANESKKTGPDGHVKKPLKPDAKSNTSTTKKENRKGKPEGLALMKEDVLDELRKLQVKKKALSEDYHYKYGKGQRVNTPDGPGTITGIMGGTVSVDLESGEQADYQFNVLDKQARDDHFKKMPNLSAQQGKMKDLAKESKKTKIVKKLKEFISKKKKTDEAKKFKAGGETIFKSDQESPEFEKELRKINVKYTKSNA